LGRVYTSVGQVPTCFGRSERPNWFHLQLVKTELELGSKFYLFICGTKTRKRNQNTYLWKKAKKKE
jgi:hypothetical protein